jgi:8-amino-7-oxononanoate synthase
MSGQAKAPIPSQAADSLDSFAAEKLAGLERRHLRRFLSETARSEGIEVVRNGRKLVSFSCNDYLNLSVHPAVKAAAVEAIQKYGVGSGASRLVTGNHPLFTELERRLAKLKSTESAVVFGTGYLANSGIIPVFAGREDLVVVDELAHACIYAGGQLSKGTLTPFRHNDIAHAEMLLREQRGKHRHALIVTDGVFSMDGDLAPVAELAALARKYDAWLMTDDAHGIGVVGGGRGSTFIRGKKDDVPLQMGTLSKAIGGFGGYLCASEPVIELVKNRARTFVYSTGLPPANAAAAIAALDIIERDPDYAALPLNKAQNFTRLTNLKLAESPIVPMVIGTEKDALEASKLLEDAGYLVVAIRPPTVPEGTARLRFSFTALHQDEDIEKLAHLVRSKILGR